MLSLFYFVIPSNAQSWDYVITLVYRIEVHARLLILNKKFPLHGLILVCTFINFEKFYPPARIFHPACLLMLETFPRCTLFFIAVTFTQAKLMIGNERKTISKTSTEVMVKNMNIIGDDYAICFMIWHV